MRNISRRRGYTFLNVADLAIGALEVVQLHAFKVPFLDLKPTFTNAFVAMLYLQENKIDLIFLEIKMPDIPESNRSIWFAPFYWFVPHPSQSYQALTLFIV